MDTLFELLRSRKLAIGLFIVISGLAVVGTIVPQAHLTPPASYQAFLQKNPTLAPLAQRLGLTALYYSWWFYALLLLLLANTAACTISRLGPLWRLLAEPPSLKDAQAIAAMPGHRSIMWPDVRPSDGAKRIGAVFRRAGYGVRLHEGESGTRAVAWKGRAGPLGSIVFHLSFIPIVLGILSMTLFGLRGVVLVDQGEPWKEGHGAYLSLKEGYLFRDRHPGFQITLNGVRPRYRRRDLVDLAADVTVNGGLGERKRTIGVNRPLSQDGFLLVLDSYGFAPLVRIAERGRARSYAYMNLGSRGIEGSAFGDRFSIAGNLQADLRFYPDAVYERGKVRVLSQIARRPLVELLLRRNGKIVFDGPVALGGTVKQGGMAVTFSKWHHYVILKLIRDPGWFVLVGGFVLAVAGLVLRAGFAYRRFWIAVEARGKSRQLLMSGRSDRYGAFLEQEMGSLLSRLQEVGEKEA